MATEFIITPPGGGYRTGRATLTATGQTGWMKFIAGDLIVQLDGAATAVTASVQRSSTNPALGSVTPAPADSTGFTGNPSTGIAPNIYTETGVGWWRVNVTDLTGTPLNISLTGKVA